MPDRAGRPRRVPSTEAPLTTRLTRKALYDLVWSRPRTTLAKEMGVSDVWIGKQCRAFNVPAPPSGNWATRAAGDKPKA